MNALQAERPIAGKVVSGVLLLSAGIAVAYMLRPLLIAAVFYLSLSLPYVVALGLSPDISPELGQRADAA